MRIDARVNPFVRGKAAEEPVEKLADHQVRQLASASKLLRDAEAEKARREEEYLTEDLAKAAAAAEASRKKAEERQEKKIHNFGKLAASTCREIEKKVHGTAEGCAAPLLQLAGLRDELKRAGAPCPSPVLKGPSLASLADLLQPYTTAAREAEAAAKAAAAVAAALEPIQALRGLR